MGKNPNYEWQLSMTKLIAEVKTNQENLHTKLDDYCDATNKRQEKMENIVIGNGKPGLAEEVRSLKGKYAAFYGLGLLFLSALLNYAVETTIFGHAASHVTEAAATETIR